MHFPLPILGVPRNRVHAVVRVMLLDRDVARIDIDQDDGGTFTVIPEPTAAAAAPAARSKAPRRTAARKASKRKASKRKGTKRKAAKKGGKRAAKKTTRKTSRKRAKKA
jgi:hypothetical protein